MLYLNGTSYTSNTHGKTPKILDIPTNIPAMDPSGKSMQMFVSNLTLTSLMHAFYLNDKFKINISFP